MRSQTMMSDDRLGKGITACVVSAAFVFLAMSGTSGHAQTQQVYKARTVVVPIDVRVLDRNGRPVQNLTADDFSIEEDGVPQIVTHFQARSLAPAASVDGVAQTGPPNADSSGFPSERVFLIVLGRLWLSSEVFGTTEAITEFLRKHLLPQDYVSVAAWGRASELTRDHERVARVVERLKAFNQAIDRLPDRADHKRRLAAHQSRPLPDELSLALETVFRADGGQSRTLSPSRGSSVHMLLDRIASDVLTSESREARNRLGASTTSSRVSGRVLEIVSGIDYLRRFEGEKHLIYVAGGGLWLPSVESDRALARVASDARVAISVVQTGGIGGFDEFGRPGAGRVNLEPLMASQHVAELTGGSASFAQWPDRVLTRIDETTRSGYLLAYSSTRPLLDGTQRMISVTVKRPPGATAHYRRSYLAQDKSIPYDHRQFIVHDRIMTAAESDRVIPDLKVTLTATMSPTTVAIDGRLDAGNVTFEETGSLWTARIETATFCTDARERLVGEAWRTLDFDLSPAEYPNGARTVLRFSVSVPVTGSARFCKVIAYDYQSDRTGSAIAVLR